jgi:cytochrome P450
VLVDKFDCFNANDCADVVDPNLDTLLAFNPFMATGAEWWSKRSEIEPGFSAERVDASFETFAAVCRNVINGLGENPAKATDLKQVKFV